MRRSYYIDKRPEDDNSPMPLWVRIAIVLYVIVAGVVGGVWSYYFIPYLGLGVSIVFGVLAGIISVFILLLVCMGWLFLTGE